jgi:hypothetical protein
MITGTREDCGGLCNPLSSPAGTHDSQALYRSGVAGDSTNQYIAALCGSTKALAFSLHGHTPGDEAAVAGMIWSL